MAGFFRDQRANEQGFTVLDAAIASTVLLTVMSSVTMLTVGGFYLTGTSRQEQVASFLANQVIEQVRALPFQVVANGLSSSDPTIAGDPNIVVTGSAPNQTFTYRPTGEVIPHGSFSYSQAPLTPHQTTVSIDGTRFTVDVYPTEAASLPGVYRVTAVVSWVDPLHGSLQRSQSAQTLVYSSGSGCLSTDTHPFSAPCQSSFYATASSGSGAITVTPVSGSGVDALSGIPLVSAQLLLTQTYSTTQIEQMSEVIGSAVTTGGIIEVSGQPQISTGSVTASSDADNDPAITTTAPQTSSVQQEAQPISYANGSTLTIAPTSSDAATSTSVTSATGSPSCLDLAGVTQTNGLPCSSSSVVQSSGTATISATLNAGGTSLGTLPIGSIGPPGAPTMTFLTRSSGSPSTYCMTATGSGCVHAAANRSVGNIAIGGLPTALVGSAPSGWGGPSCNGVNALIQLDGFADSVVAESGSGSSMPSAAQTAGTLLYWNGSGCSSLPVNWQASPGTLSIPTVTLSAPTVDMGVEVTESATVSLGGTSTTYATPPGCTSACTASASSASPVTVMIAYAITDGSQLIADFDIDFSLGTLAASTSWQAAS
jgi:hypothetical protein